MVADDPTIATTHLRMCARFGRVVSEVDGRWERPSPCAGWDARAVLEHVIGFHDVLLLRPLDAKPARPQHDPERRWSLTLTALRAVLQRPGLFDGVVEVPALGDLAPTRIDARRLVPALSQDVLVHTWDLARAVGVNDRLDPALCKLFLDALPEDPGALTHTGMYDAPVAIDARAGAQAQLLARLGRDPAWTRANWLTRP
ncbi:MAG TPA: TIGR03086 family metal-binding protein [Acidimicrobiia bacterium]|jgi:uncharacterized protein (TIGR03086 family)